MWPSINSPLPTTALLLLPLLVSTPPPLVLVLVLLMLLLAEMVVLVFSTTSELSVQNASARYFSASRLSSWWLGDRAKPSLHSRRALWRHERRGIDIAGCVAVVIAFASTNPVAFLGRCKPLRGGEILDLQVSAFGTNVWEQYWWA